jgi:3-deoxy-D-manno-octulosonic-acid transferase
MVCFQLTLLETLAARYPNVPKVLTIITQTSNEEYNSHS